MCNLLRIPVIVFTGMINFPVIPLVPRGPAVCSQPICVAYDQYSVRFLHVRRESHEYEKKEKEVASASLQPTVSIKPCRCGTGAAKGTNQSSCVGIKCKCSASGNSCKNCNCKNCANPFGQRETKSISSGVPSPRKRRRHIHSLQKTDLQFLQASTEETPKWNWELFERILLLELTRDILDRGELDIMGLSEIMSKLREDQLKDKVMHFRDSKEVRKQIFAAIGTDSAYKILLKEQLRMNSM